MGVASGGDRGGWLTLSGIWVAPLCIALLAGALAAPERAAAQGTGPLVQFDPASRVIVVVPLDDKFTSDMIVGYNAQPGAVAIYFVELNGGLTPGTGCQWINPALPNVVACPPPPQAASLVFPSPGAAVGRKLQLAIPKLPLGIAVFGGGKADAIKGSPNDEKIDTGKGNDTVNPGKGKDDVNLGPGNDKAMTRDGEVDQIDGGKGKDVAEVDGKDKVKNVEVVRRK